MLLTYCPNDFEMVQVAPIIIIIIIGVLRALCTEYTNWVVSVVVYTRV